MKIKCKCGNYIFVVVKVRNAGKNIVANLKCSMCDNKNIFKKADKGKEVKITRCGK